MAETECTNPNDAAAVKSDPLVTAAGVLGLLWIIMPAVAGITLLTKIGLASDWLESHGSEAVFVYVGAFAILSGCGLLPTYAPAVLGGWVFGVAVGLPAALAGFGIGAIIGFGVTRLVARDHVQQYIDRKPKARVIRDALVGHGFWRTFATVILLRVSPSSPFALTNLAMASGGVRFVPYTVGTIVGMLPRTAIAIILAASAAATGAHDLQAFARERGPWLLVIGIVTLLICAAIIGAIAKHALDRMNPGDLENPDCDPETDSPAQT